MKIPRLRYYSDTRLFSEYQPGRGLLYNIGQAAKFSLKKSWDKFKYSILPFQYHRYYEKWGTPWQQRHSRLAAFGGRIWDRVTDMFGGALWRAMPSSITSIPGKLIGKVAGNAVSSAATNTAANVGGKVLNTVTKAANTGIGKIASDAYRYL